MSQIKKGQVVEIKGVSFGYNYHPVIEGINFSLSAGDYLWVIGPNGSGKTTLMKLILGILKPNRGRVALFGKNIEEFTDWRRIAYVPQGIVFFDPFFPATALEVATIGLLPEKKVPKRIGADDRKRVLSAFEKVGIAPLAHRRIGELSRGQRHRVLLAKAIVSNPDLLLLDEPTAAVEPGVREDFFKIVDDLNAEGTTIILINHDIVGMGVRNNKILYINRTQIFFGEGGEFCLADEMGNYFGSFQHIICHQHPGEE